MAFTEQHICGASMNTGRPWTDERLREEPRILLLDWDRKVVFRIVRYPGQTVCARFEQVSMHEAIKEGSHEKV